MNIQLITLSLVIFVGIIGLNSSYAEVDDINEIEFLKTGKLFTSEYDFLISNELTIREFFDGRIIRISGITTEGHPYVTYSKIINEQFTTHGLIYLNDKFVQMNFEKQKATTKDNSQKNEDVLILSKVPQRTYSKETVRMDFKIFDQAQNKLNDFNQNYGYLQDVNIKIVVLDDQKNTFTSFDGKTDERGFFNSEFFIPENQSRGTFTINITAENENSKSFKSIEIFNLGQKPDDG